MSDSHAVSLKRGVLVLAGPLGAAGHDLDPVRDHSLSAILHLERDVFNEESPHLITETVRIERAL